MATVILATTACVGAEGTEFGADDGSGGKADDFATGVTLDFKSYDVLFTNPLCREYKYSSPVETADGSGDRAGKPINVYCKSGDAGPSAARELSPQRRLVEWISALNDGDEIFLAYLSFSNSIVGGALNDAADRGVKVTFVLDAPTPLSNELKAHGGDVQIRGHKGGVGYQHNKVIIINPNSAGPADEDPDYVRMTFSSGNMSSGVVTHHENWHFLEVARSGYFAQSHMCMMRSLLDADAASSKSKYRKAINNCRKAISALPEDDIRAFFIPVSDDSRGITDRMLNGVQTAASIDMGAHRFGHSGLIDELAWRLESDTSFSVRMVADDDLYWLRPYGGGEPEDFGPNEEWEAWNVHRLFRAGDEERYQIRYLETNDGANQLHHNKYLMFKDEDGAAYALLTGAANLTGTGFKDNFENIYWITTPHILEQFERQYARVWDGVRADGDTQDPPVATPPELMPSVHLLP